MPFAMRLRHRYLATNMKALNKALDKIQRKMLRIVEEKTIFGNNSVPLSDYWLSANAFLNCKHPTFPFSPAFPLAYSPSRKSVFTIYPDQPEIPPDL
jgi:hypothetical protein